MVYPSLILTCEHAGNQIPTRYRSFFADAEVSYSTQGWYDGARVVTVSLAESLGVSCFLHETSPFLVDINHTLGKSQLFSKLSQSFGDEDKQLLLDKYYFPYRLRVENAIAAAPKPVLHISIGTFSPNEASDISTSNVSLFIDAARELERTTAARLIKSVEQSFENLQLKKEEVKAESHDSFVSYLRTRFLADEYIGIEVKINQHKSIEGQLTVIAQALQNALLALAG